jgi:hypothetical protein
LVAAYFLRTQQSALNPIVHVDFFWTVSRRNNTATKFVPTAIDSKHKILKQFETFKLNCMI